MKIRKGLTVLFYVLLLAVCLWILHRIGLSEYDDHGSAQTTEFQEYEKEPFSDDHTAADGEAEQVFGGVNGPDWEKLWQDMRTVIHYITFRHREIRLIQEARLHRGQQAKDEAYRKWLWDQECTAGEPEESEPPYVPPQIMIASDLHFMSRRTHDGGAAFQKMVAADDGKVSQYSEEILDTLLQEALERQPSALVLAGDNTLNGERINHEELAKRLQKLVDAGIAVLIIPGNHDIQNHSAATYFGDKQEETAYLETAEEFLEIYHDFGYDQALSCDPSSLSYVYALDGTHWMMMLDSCQYENGNRVNGRIRSETLTWMREQFKLAQEQGVSVVPVAHHNLLSESRLYTVECTMENHEEVLALLEEFHLPLYFSGHLHAQRIKKHKAAPGTSEDAYGVTEIVMSPVSIPPCQYGSLTWKEDGRMVFEIHTADVAAGYRKEKMELTAEDRDFLDHFSVRGEEFVKQIRKNQVEKTLYLAPDDLKEQMARLYANLYFDYCAGNQMTWGEVRTTKAFKLWERLYPDSAYMAEMKRMVEDVRENLHNWNSGNKDSSEKEGRDGDIRDGDSGDGDGRDG